MRFEMPFKPLLPRFASVHGSTQPGPGLPDPDPAAPGGIPPGPAEPFPLEPGDIPAPEPGAQPPYGEPEPVEQPKEPERVAARGGRVLTALEEMNEFLLVENLRLDRTNHRLELALSAALLAASPTLNYLHNVARRLEAADVRGLGDHMELLHREASGLVSALAPLCRKPVEPPKLAVVG